MLDWIENKGYERFLQNAIKKETTPYNLDKDKKIANFVGKNGEIYTTTLEACNCTASDMYAEPCKHRIRLAIELGLLNYDVQSDTSIPEYILKCAKIAEFIQYGTYDKVKEFIDLINPTGTLKTKNDTFNYYYNNEITNVLFETNSKGKIILTKDAKVFAKTLKDRFIKRIGTEYFYTGNINKSSGNDI